MNKHNDHYKALNFQPDEIAREWLSVEELQGAYRYMVMKYIGRFRNKGTPLQDLEKAKVYLDWLIDSVKKESVKEIPQSDKSHIEQSIPINQEFVRIWRENESDEKYYILPNKELFEVDKGC